MNKYCIKYQYENGDTGIIKCVAAANISDALKHFEKLGYKDVVSVDCVLIEEEMEK